MTVTVGNLLESPVLDLTKAMDREKGLKIERNHGRYDGFPGAWSIAQDRKRWWRLYGCRLISDSSSLVNHRKNRIA
ncbi:hypothetical protein KIN20_025969 [Parelaphostrongylus tenuis]|uniref:Uncharacterized protein n=1 Tax=Parelaphostrongylus tenuis TaxID=148309 RepID=A0AAD5QWW3_PARTN|nr:hypothetical protein KIN20_025969 [Parelaphostrongylus tenuis]